MNLSRFVVRFGIALPLLLCTVAHANLLTNPGAESGNLSGWTSGGPGTPQVDAGSFNPGINAHSGGYDFLGHDNTFSSLTQNVSIVGIANAALATISFWEQGLNQGPLSDNAFVSLVFRDAGNGVISMVMSPVIDSHNLTWQNYQGSFAIPVGTTSIDYVMNFVRNQGSDLDAYIDDNTLDVIAATPPVNGVPEPGTALIFGLGVVAALISRRAGQ